MYVGWGPCWGAVTLKHLGQPLGLGGVGLGIGWPQWGSGRWLNLLLSGGLSCQSCRPQGTVSLLDVLFPATGPTCLGAAVDDISVTFWTSLRQGSGLLCSLRSGAEGPSPSALPGLPQRSPADPGSGPSGWGSHQAGHLRPQEGHGGSCREGGQRVGEGPGEAKQRRWRRGRGGS